MKLLNKELLIKNIDEAADYDLKNNKVFGSAYYVFQKGNLIFEKCYGTTSIGGESVTPSTLFRLASMTKPVTTIATLILVERGLIDLDDPIEKYLPKFKGIHVIDMEGKDLGEVRTPPTIRHALSHCSGIGSYCEKYAHVTQKDKETIDSYIDFFINIGLDFEPEAKQIYSGTAAFDVLAKIIELVSGKDLYSFLKEEIFDPCGMSDTIFTPSTEQWKNFIAMHNKIDGENVEDQMKEGAVFERFPSTHYLGGAGLASTLEDYSKFAKMLLNGGEAENKRIVSRDLIQAMSTPQVPKSIMGGNERWGLGVRVITEEEYLYLPVGSFGWSGAYGSHFWIDPKNQIFAVYMKNSKFDGGAANESARFFEKAVYSSFK